MKSAPARVAAVGCFLVATSAFAFTPLTGHWWNPAESGSGYNIDIQNGVLVVAAYSYKSNGDSEWYLASGAMTPDQRTFTGSLDMYRNGQCISCAYQGSPSSGGSTGAITINFLTETSATVSLPGGRTTSIQPFNFGFGDPPAGLLGEWVYVYDIVSTTWADRFNYTATAGATPDGNGVVVDKTRVAACEYQVKGAFAGEVLCFDYKSATDSTVQNIYRYRFGLSETFSGSWISPTSFNAYPMKGFRVKSTKGATRTSAAGGVESSDDPNAGAKQIQDESRNPVKKIQSATLDDEAAAMARVIAETRRILFPTQ